jgi:prepilin-type processing-associated H-X9-DG protein
VEVLVVIAIIALLAALALPTLSDPPRRTKMIACLNNQKQLGVAWLMYADENGDLLVNNHGTPETLARRQTWANNVQDWLSSDDNTNLTLLATSKLATYLGGNTGVYKCPADTVPGPNGPRIRSMAMNAMVGNPGEVAGRFNPLYEQFYKKSSITVPAAIFVFLDEQADTLNDGFFVNQLEDYKWGNVPGSYHSGGGNFQFADGHVEGHHWRVASTQQPVRGARIEPFSATPATDFDWLKARTSVKKR